MNKRFLSLIILLLSLAFVLSACGAGGGDGATIRIGSKEFTEQYLLGNMYEMLLDDAGFDARFTPMGGTAENHRALIEEEIDLYPEYTGTALLTQLEMEYDPSMSADEVYNTVKEAYEEQYGLTLLEPTNFNNTYCLTMTQERAQELGLQTASDLSQAAPDLVFGTTQEFIERSDGLPGLQSVYGGFNFAEVVGLDPGLLYTGLDEGDIDVTTCFGTDGQIAAFDLVVLEDDQNFWPPYPAAPVVRQEILDEHPEIADVLNQLSSRLDGENMRQLNWEVAGNAREADEVAREFLIEQGLIEE
ncbi:MAG TPA: glycine betaine ABC transporter substrate-binding protein [Candidatus Sulfomarinibacteraceae bacterium]|nr:glycine betaine ABC transporter substrate-binding protein [Candidatus Sulfomarinibacteraceae bacterium]